MAFGDVTLELLRTAGGDASTYALSRPLKPGRHIDWFMSHSWHDDAAAKLEAFQRLGEAFKCTHGRYPTVWLDKTCINQAGISDALKCLPVFLQACECVVAFVGPTYFQRLWCVWELYTRLAFTSAAKHELLSRAGRSRSRSRARASRALTAAAALNDTRRMTLVPLRSLGRGTSPRALVRGFELSRARCFDPNEQGKLLGAIGAAQGGRAAFQEAVRGLVTQLDGMLPLVEPEAVVAAGTGDVMTPPASSKWRGIGGTAGTGDTADPPVVLQELHPVVLNPVLQELGVDRPSDLTDS